MERDGVLDDIRQGPQSLLKNIWVKLMPKKKLNSFRLLIYESFWFQYDCLLVQSRNARLEISFLSNFWLFSLSAKNIVNFISCISILMKIKLSKQSATGSQINWNCGIVFCSFHVWHCFIIVSLLSWWLTISFCHTFSCQL